MAKHLTEERDFQKHLKEREVDRYFWSEFQSQEPWHF